MTKRISKIINKNAFSLLFATWCVMFLPALKNAGWFYYDTPTNILRAQSIFNNMSSLLPSSRSERIIPMFWFFQSLIYGLFGLDPIYFFIFRILVVLLSGTLIYKIVLHYTKSQTNSLLSGVIFFTSSAIAENAFTIGKSEPLFLAIILLIIYIVREKNEQIHKHKVLMISFILIILTCALQLTKETGVIVLIYFISILICLIILSKKKAIECKSEIRKYLIYMGASVFGLLLAIIPYSINKVELDYTTYQINISLILNNLKFYFFQQPDILMLILISLGISLYHLLTFQGNSKEILIEKCIYFSLSIVSIAYIGGMLFWRFALGYYLYVPAGIISIAFVGILKNVIVSKFNRRRLIYFMAFSLIITRIYSIPYFYYVSTSQKAQEHIFTEAMETYSILANNGERLICEQWPIYCEAVVQSNVLMRIIAKEKDLEVIGISDILDKSHLKKDIPNEEEIMPKVGDYVIQLYSYHPSYWFVRGVSPVISNQNSKLKARGYKLDLVSNHSISIKEPILNIGLKKLGIEDNITGYNLYQITDASFNEMVWEGRYTDKWIGKSASLTYSKDTTFKIVIKNNSINTYNSIVILNNNNIVKAIEIEKNSTITVEINEEEIQQNENGLYKIDFEVENTFNPKQNNLSEDNRDLGVIINLAEE